MAIRFKCRHCKKTLGVKDHLAGRKAICPACHKPIVIPKPKPTDAEVEALAASMLGDAEEKKEVKPKVEAKPIEFHCEFCDEKVTVPFADAGTKLPCPECKRIIRVPVPDEDKPKDWRDVSKKGPMGAKANQPEELDNAWGTEQTRRVTGQALLEADAIPVAIDTRGRLGRWLKRGLLGSVTVAFVYLAVGGMMRSRAEILENAALGDALKLAATLPAEWAAEIHRAAGEIYCSKLMPFPAQQQFRTAQGKLQTSPNPGIDADLFLIDLALSQIEMGGEGEDIIAKSRLAWREVQGDVGKTLESINSADVRGLALRLVGARFIQKKQMSLAVGIAGNSPPQLLGLLLAAAQDQDKEASKNARKALKDQGKEEAPKADGSLDPDVRHGYVEGLARQGKYKEALALCDKPNQENPGETKQRLAACLAGAELALANRNPDDAGQFVDKALEMIGDLRKQQALIPRWLIFATVRAGIEANFDGPRRAAPAGEAPTGEWSQELVKSLDPAKQPKSLDVKELAEVRSLHAQLHLLMFRQKLAKATAAIASVEGLGAEKGQRDLLAWPLAWQALARRQARSRANVLSLKETAQDERLEAFLLVGYALGQHDRLK
jgi:Zn finger protein HypA/HybF involved in hydrogenase expression